MECEKCELLPKEINLLKTLLKVEENKVEELMKLLDKIRKADEFKL